MAELVVDDLTVEYHDAGQPVRPLDGLTFSARDGELVVVKAPSGGGKTTLLCVLAGLLSPTKGSVSFGSTIITGLSGRDLLEHRRRTAGMVFQSFNLIASLSAVENVSAPLVLTGTPARTARSRALAALGQVGLDDRASFRPGRLSGGQQQRVAFARALVREPALLLADEPTAHLDAPNARTAVKLLREFVRPGRVVVVATHDDRFLEVADRLVDPSSARAA
ncbi:ABC transporter ATP-binding protein [Microbacterium sp. NPDC019599]|uniref:ABC transporter ATP-binding protein n=1 Tax=Microbacterium sp. NPDC019599 TaxID=3154690 RepID=UPI00340CDA89